MRKYGIYALVAAAVMTAGAMIGERAVPVFEDGGAVEMPVIMYHSILKNSEQTGKYIITPETLRRDIDYLYNHGYSTVSMQDLFDYIDEGKPLPEKPVMLTFDDGCYNNLSYALPILEEKKAHGVFSIVGKYTDDYTRSNEVNPAYSYMRWTDVNELLKSEYAEVGCHSYNFHSLTEGRKGARRNKGEDADEYLAIFETDLNRFNTAYYANTGERTQIYTFPYGAYSEESLEILKNTGIRATLSCTEGMNRITRNEKCLELIKRSNRPGGISSEEFFYTLLKQ